MPLACASSIYINEPDPLPQGNSCLLPPCLAQDVIFQPFGEGAVLFRQSTRKLAVLNRTAAVIWCLLAETKTEDEIKSALMEMFGISQARSAADLAGMIELLRKEGLLAVAGEDGREQSSTDVIALQSLPRSNQACSKSKLQYYHAAGCTFEFACDDQRFDQMLRQLFKPLTETPPFLYDLRLAVESAKDNHQSWDIWVDNALLYPAVIEQSVLPHILLAVFERAWRGQDNHLLFHAATLVKNEKAVLFAGGVGSGKTTLALCLAARGWQFYSDELAVIDPVSLQVRPFAMPVSIKPGAFDLLRPLYPDLAGTAVHTRPDGKIVRYLRPPADLDDTVRPPVAVGALIFPEYHENLEPVLTPIEPVEALHRLAATCSSDRLLSSADVQAMLALAATRPCYTLRHGNAVEACELLENIELA